MGQLHIRTHKYSLHRAVLRTNRAMVIEFKQENGVRAKFKQKKLAGEIMQLLQWCLQCKILV
jgi:hypothetical protein